ncbi:uncharacterized protein LOC129778607 [Toxorhynchites rutilus septentrionalis]|uniref:uncharacterized protein LOC129778607 n=1 Tax=Toxorhynchites rutilus septentrionalis TaxID=329112 RepID=UPI0024796A4E|nr:uncharacterized protein LOC129778607 [Toxorhynchites rutilus septentrionalis]
MAKKYFIGFVIWFCFLQRTSAEQATAPNRPTNLEDIERDNLKNERHLAYTKNSVASQQSHVSSSQGGNQYSFQIEHHPGGATSHAGFNYVTPIPSSRQASYFKEYTPQFPQKVPQVHEDHSTYTVPSRQSLVQPIIGGSAPTQTFLTPQPQYVYVQAQPQQIQQYANQNLPQSPAHALPQNQQAYIMVPTAYYQPPHSAQQYAAFVNDPNNHVQVYQHGATANGNLQQFNAPLVQQAPIKSHGIVYAQPAPAPPRQQSPSAEYSVIKSVEPQMYLSNNHLPSPSGIQYSHSPAKPAIQIHQETQTSYPSLSHPNNGILNYLGVQHKSPTSLLDSYVPSGLQVSPAKPYAYPKYIPHYQPQNLNHYQPQLFYQPPHQATPHSPYPSYVPHGAAPAQFPAAQGYNTIAYSVPLSFSKPVSQYKRSPMLESVFSVKQSSPKAVSSAVTSTKLQPSTKQI